jgi:hypothetical protein
MLHQNLGDSRKVQVLGQDDVERGARPRPPDLDRARSTSSSAGADARQADQYRECSSAQSDRRASASRFQGEQGGDLTMAFPAREPSKIPGSVAQKAGDPPSPPKLLKEAEPLNGLQRDRPQPTEERPVAEFGRLCENVKDLPSKEQASRLRSFRSLRRSAARGGPRSALTYTPLERCHCGHAPGTQSLAGRRRRRSCDIPPAWLRRLTERMA